MAATQQQLKAIEADNKTSKGKEKPAQQQAVGEDNASQTRRAARASDPKELFATLSHKAMEGDIESARLLVKMTNSAKPIKPVKKKRHGLTYAQQLALDPPWQGDPDQDFLDLDDPLPESD